MQYINPAGLPASVVTAIKRIRERYDRGRSDFTATELGTPARLRALRKLHDDVLVADIADEVWSLRGSALHYVLEQAEVHQPERLYRDIEVDGRSVCIGGAFDSLALDPTGELDDFKDTSVWAVVYGPKPEWIAQLNVYRWLCAANGYVILRLFITAFLKDWKEADSLKGGNYPPQNVWRGEMPVWTDAETEGYIRERVRAHWAAEQALREDPSGSTLPECSPAEMWESPTKYSVRKKGGKRAIKGGNYSDALSADMRCNEEGADKHEVVVTPGVRKRCMRHCLISRNGKCEQWERWLIENPPGASAETDSDEAAA